MRLSNSTGRKMNFYSDGKKSGIMLIALIAVSSCAHDPNQSFVEVCASYLRPLTLARSAISAQRAINASKDSASSKSKPSSIILA